MMKKWILWLLPFMVLLLAGCTAELLSADTLPWVSDESILFADDFTHPTGGWLTHEDRLSFVGYAQNGFRLWVDLPNYQVWSRPGLNFKDSHTYTRAQKLAGPNDNLMGVMCRYQNEGNYYAFVISSDGYYGIIKKQANVQSLLGSEQMGFNEAIHRGNAVNEILAVCQGDQLVLFVNEVKLLQVSDTTFAHGDAGLISGNREQPGVDILFDYFIVIKP
jgi:hypothetical protein